MKSNRTRSQKSGVGHFVVKDEPKGRTVTESDRQAFRKRVAKRRAKKKAAK